MSKYLNPGRFAARVFIVLLVLATLVSLTYFYQGTPASLSSSLPASLQSTSDRKGRLHLLIPATSTNKDLCALLLSAQILGYPTPVLINYGAKEDPDPYKQHMGKVQGILDHLNRIQTTDEFAEDMVLVVDGYDVWFQLGPDVLMKRYHEVAHAADQRVTATYGKTSATQHDMRHTILFGPDKICWPIDYSRPACWAVPATTLPEQGFGPGTRSGREEQNDPRWLNSGTIMGPLQDMRNMFEATLEWIHTDYTVDSDQFYFAELFGLQEYARLSQKPTLLKEVRRVPHGDESRDANATLVRNEPVMLNRQTEYHIFIDGASALFQTLAFWKQYLVWMRPADAWTEPESQQRARLGSQPYAFNMPQDLADSRPPFFQLGGNHDNSSQWADVELLYNVVSGVPPVLIHFTGEKRFREVWWKRIWWQSSAKTLREATQANLGNEMIISSDVIGGHMWHNAVSDHAQELGSSLAAVIDRGAFLTWRGLCGVYEPELYAVPDDEYFHAPPLPSENS